MKRSAIALILAALTAATLTACGKSSNVTIASSTAVPAASGGTVVAAAGSTFRGKLKQEISTKKSHDGDQFTIVATNGETVDGHLENVQAAGFGKKPSMVIVFDDLKSADGSTAAPIDVKIVNAGKFDAKTHHWRTFGMVIGGAMAGHMAGSAAHTKHGSTAGAAGGYMLSQEMKTDVDVRPGTTVVLKFNKDAVSSNATPSQQ